MQAGWERSVAKDSTTIRSNYNIVKHGIALFD